ncbi:MAG: DUF1697 domain-containing protein [Pseudolysinimonas sp.]
MSTLVVLIRGINVGGKNPVAMSGLRDLLEELGCTNVATLLVSGNAVVDTTMSAADVCAKLEKALPAKFTLHDESVKVLVLTEKAFRAAVDQRPRGFGTKPELHHSDAIFLIGVSVAEAMKVFDPRDGVDAVWPGTGVIYSQRLSAQRTKSRLGKIIGTTPYKSMTIRSWATTLKLIAMLDARAAAS